MPGDAIQVNSSTDGIEICGDGVVVAGDSDACGCSGGTCACAAVSALCTDCPDATPTSFGFALAGQTLCPGCITPDSTLYFTINSITLPSSLPKTSACTWSANGTIDYTVSTNSDCSASTHVPAGVLKVTLTRASGGFVLTIDHLAAGADHIRIFTGAATMTNCCANITMTNTNGPCGGAGDNFTLYAATGGIVSLTVCG